LLLGRGQTNINHHFVISVLEVMGSVFLSWCDSWLFWLLAW